MYTHTHTPLLFLSPLSLSLSLSFSLCLFSLSHTHACVLDLLSKYVNMLVYTCTLYKQTNIKSTKEGCGSSQMLFLCPVLISGCNEREGGSLLTVNKWCWYFIATRWNCWRGVYASTATNTKQIPFLTCLPSLFSLSSLSHSRAGKRADQEWPNSTWAPGEEAAHSDQQNGKTSWDHGKINAQQYAHIFTLFEYAWYIVCAQVSWSLLSYS